jgi:predicted RNase H-like HicB family nuclease
VARIVLHEGTTQRLASRAYRFTVIFQPLAGEIQSAKSNGQSRSRKLLKNPAECGYQVTVPMLPGLITYGCTLGEAREMAADAIRVHLEGLREVGEPIPDEATARTEKLCIAISA